MDPLSDVLGLLKPKGFGFRGVDGAGEWSLQFDASDGIKVFAIESGECFMAIDHDDFTVRVGPGDLVMFPGRTAYRLFTAASMTPVNAFSFFRDVPPGTTGTINGGGTSFGVGGFFSFEGVHSQLLLDALPSVIFIKAESSRAALDFLIRRLMEELRSPQIGGALVAGHLAQTLLVEALRLHLTDRAGGSTGWLSALADDRMRTAITAMHADPAKPWTLVDLARVAAMSRSSFAARFKETVGEGALEYLTRWRMMLAADKLSQGHTTLAAVAPEVGYQSESAFGIAFKRVLGQSPRQFVQGNSR